MDCFCKSPGEYFVINKGCVGRVDGYQHLLCDDMGCIVGACICVKFVGGEEMPGLPKVGDGSLPVVIGSFGDTGRV
jgi:hypothetical protein